MIKVENIEVWGFEHAIRGMRNPLNSWDKSDSGLPVISATDSEEQIIGSQFTIGEADMFLMHRLYKSGTEHRKYLRQIFISLDIVAPLYWWKEFDTYKIGTTSNSCSTMHKIHSKEFVRDDFSHEHLTPSALNILDYVIVELNVNRASYLETKDKKWWWNMIQLLPSSYNQRRTITMSYENVVNILNQRKYHRLDEWRSFCRILYTLPHLADIMQLEKEEELSSVMRDIQGGNNEY